jgi:hypothetical protein
MRGLVISATPMFTRFACAWHAQRVRDRLAPLDILQFVLSKLSGGQCGFRVAVELAMGHAGGAMRSWPWAMPAAQCA